MAASKHILPNMQFGKTECRNITINHKTVGQQTDINQDVTEVKTLIRGHLEVMTNNDNVLIKGW